MSARDVRLERLEAAADAARLAELSRMSDAELEAASAALSPVLRATVCAMTDDQLAEAVAGRWPADVPRPEEASP